MNYEIVSLTEKTVIGVSARTNNQAPDMGNVIGGLWGRFYQEGIYASIADKRTGKSLGIYTDYEGDEKDDYTVMAACEVNHAQTVPEGTVVRTFPAGRYAKFVVIGDMQKAVAEFWGKLWEMDLPRSFTYDFEEYQDGEMERAEIHIYIGLKEE